MGANRIAQNRDEGIFKASGGVSSEHFLPVGETGDVRRNHSNALYLSVAC